MSWFKILDLRDYVGLIGIGCIGAGIGVIYWPAALIVVGGILLYLSVGGIRRNGTSE